MVKKNNSKCKNLLEVIEDVPLWAAEDGCFDEKVPILTVKGVELKEGELTVIELDRVEGVCEVTAVVDIGVVGSVFLVDIVVWVVAFEAGVEVECVVDVVDSDVAGVFVVRVVNGVVAVDVGSVVEVLAVVEDVNVVVSVVVDVVVIQHVGGIVVVGVVV